jgi:hypothetical protein
MRYGSAEGDFIKDRYMGTYATARAVGPWVVGVIRAPAPGAAATALEALADVVSDVALPPRPEEAAEPALEKDAEGYDEY